MRVSRVSKETAKFVTKASDGFSRRQTRSLATTLQTFAANPSSLEELNNTTVKQEEKEEKEEKDDDDTSSLSSLASLDIEDLANLVSPLKKRKRGVTRTENVLASPITRFSTRKSDIKDEDEKTIKTKKVRRQPAKPAINRAGEVEIHPPAKWEEIYDTVKEMRKRTLAPVDTMGCETLAEDRRSPRVCPSIPNGIVLTT